MTETIHTYEFEYWNGEEWMDCQLYCSERDDVRITEEFIQQQQDADEPYDDLRVLYVGEGEFHCGTDYQEGLKLRVF